MRLILILLFMSESSKVFARCPDHSFLGCMLRLKAQRVPIEKNILSLIFNIGTEARLLHTCKVYSSTLPCFQEKIRECGDDKQKRILNEVSKTIMYLCSPFSLKRQNLVIEHQKCISGVLSLPASTGCQLDDNEYGKQVISCKKECNSRGLICMMRTWISEQNTCTMKDIDQKCGAEAASLFQELQTTVFEPTYPVVCTPSNETIATVRPKISNLKEKKIKTQYRKPIQKSKTEIQEHPMVLTSPATPSTADNIYIALPEQTNVYLRPQRPTFAANLTNNNAAQLYPNQVELQEKSNIWNKGDYGQKVQYNKEHWRQKTSSGEFVFTTQHPLFTTTEYGATPRRHKVIDILKSLIPPNLPSQLTALLENSYDKEIFAETQSYNTPAVATPMSNIYATSQAVYQPEIVTIAPKTTMIPPQPVKITYRPSTTHAKSTMMTTTQPIVQYPILPATTVKWKPWYLGGA
ncbi:DUF19 domain-containing protein [Caenorhabditis elegans]|uniref:DUF19 domain-containing protein n=1 Tax=Caenorhabditis elegans TaxID=6239 RepID=Q17665_CAEEL|nr:DUF19 domain-containing protein [Caenorhabditis elegans]CCD63263.1 DUF19 domain-containing protein [Caenorhabditis elegans]|eukprot:NP_508786.1 Uncharacterized protein CELE_C05E11.7 [Caenorhabditis elegans]